jgi:hypothetical protein
MIIALRDSELYVHKIRTLFEQQVKLFNELEYFNFRKLNIESVIEELQSIKSDDDNLCMFISDLIEMLSRKQHDIGSVHRTLLWATIAIHLFAGFNINIHFDHIFMYTLWNSL